MTASTQTPTASQQSNPSTLRRITAWVVAAAWLGLLVVSIAMLSIMRDMDKALDRANARLARMNAANATSANLDR